MNFLIVDDHALIFESLSMHLSERFTNATFSYEPECNLDIIAGKMPIDCIVLDLDLGNGVCYKTLGQIHNRFTSVPIIVLSASKDPLAGRCSKAFGASAFIIKNHDTGSISRVFELVLKHGMEVFPIESGEECGMSENGVGFGISLTARETDVLNCLIETGATNMTIAETLKIAETTVKSHLSSAFRKVGVANRVEAIVKLSAPRSLQTPSL